MGLFSKKNKDEEYYESILDPYSMYEVLYEDKQPFEIEFFKYSILSSSEKISDNINSWLSNHNIKITGLEVADNCISIEYHKADEHNDYTAIALQGNNISSIEAVEKLIND